MSKKSQLTKFQSILNGDMSTASITSSVSSIEFVDDIGIQFNWTGAPVGVFSVQISVDYAQDTSSPPNVQVTGNWIDLVFTYWNGSGWVTATSIPATVGSPIYIDLPLLSAPWIRCKYTRTSGTGTLNAFLTNKSVSG